MAGFFLVDDGVTFFVRNYAIFYFDTKPFFLGSAEGRVVDVKFVLNGDFRVLFITFDRVLELLEVFLDFFPYIS